MKQQIINLEHSYIALTKSKVSENLSAMKSIKEIIKELKKFNSLHRFIKLPVRDKKPNWNVTEIEIVKKVGETFICTPEEIFGKSRKTHIVHARHLCSYILHVEMKLSCEEVGTFVGKDHSTITFSCNNAMPRLLNDNMLFLTKKEIVYNYLRKYKIE